MAGDASYTCRRAVTFDTSEIEKNPRRSWFFLHLTGNNSVLYKSNCQAQLTNNKTAKHGVLLLLKTRTTAPNSQAPTPGWCILPSFIFRSQRSHKLEDTLLVTHTSNGKPSPLRLYGRRLRLIQKIQFQNPSPHCEIAAQPPFNTQRPQLLMRLKESFLPLPSKPQEFV